MSQQFPYNPVGNGLPAMPPMIPNLGGPGPGLNLPGGLPPMDPRLLQQMQQAGAQGSSDSVMLEMANAMMPSATGLVTGAAVGIGAHAALGRFIENKATGTSTMAKFANWLDTQFSRLPILGNWVKKFDEKILPRIQSSNSDYLKQLFVQIDPTKIEENLIRQQITNLRSTWLERAATRLDGLFGGKWFGNTANRILDPLKKSSIPWIQKRAMGKLSAQHVDRLLKIPNLSVAKAHTEIDKILTEISGGAKPGSFAPTSAAFTRDWKRLKGLRKSLQGLENFYLRGYRQQYDTLGLLAKEAKASGKAAAGPVGRFIANMTHHINRIFGGEFIPMGQAGAQAQGGFMSKVFGPSMAGIFSFGMAVTEAQKAEDGDKLKTFAHTFLGIGIAQMIGLEVGHKILRPLVTKGMSVMATWQLPSLLRFIPMLGRVTWLGFAAEIVGMMVLSQPFQKVGEWISTKIFGKPKSLETREAKEAQEAQQRETERAMAGKMPGRVPMGNPAVFQPFMNDKRIPAPVLTPPVQATGLPPQPAVHHGSFAMTPEQIMADLPVYNQDQQIQQQFTQALGNGHIEPGQLYTNPFAYGVEGH